MGYWLKQMNYPIVKIDIQRLSVEKKTKINFQQSRFLLAEDTNPNPIYVSPYGYIWQIYLKCTAGGTFDSSNSSNESQHIDGETFDFNFFLDQTQDSLEIDEREFTWVKCNNDFTSFLMTEYSDEIFKNLVTALKLNDSLFSSLDRANLIHIAYQLAYLGTKSYSIPALLNDHLKSQENEYVPWRVFYSHVSRIAALLETRTVFEQLSNFGIKITSELAENLNLWDDSGSHLEKRLKSIMVDFVCRMQDNKCLLNATQSFNQLDTTYFQDPNNQVNSISPNIRLSTYRYHIQNTIDFNDWNNLFKVYINSADPQEQSNVLSALSYSKSTWILNRYLQDLLVNSSVVRSQDFFTVVNSVSRNPSGRYLAWYFMRQRWDDIVAK
jgi:pyroglutamyl-peptidase II